MKRQTITVIHPQYGEVTVKAARNQMDALNEAARQWGTTWTSIILDVTFQIKEG